MSKLSPKEKDQLAEDTINLVYHIARKYGGEDYEELVGIGMIGLTKALNNYSNREFKFVTLAYRCIANEINKHFKSKKYAKRDGVNVSLQEPIGGNGDGEFLTFEDVLIDEKPLIEDIVVLKNEVGIVMSTIDELPNKDKAIFLMRVDELTFREIASKLGMTHQWANIKYKNIVDKIKKKVGKKYGLK
jgi:RNA polymerase sigma factor (sigma-70 family)